jgi:MoxR-like ATPase
MLLSHEQAHPLNDLAPVMTVADLERLQAQRREVYVDDRVRDYIVDLVSATRTHPDVQLGASPRATLALFAMCQAWALLHDREYALPDDVKAVASAVLRHRIVSMATTDEAWSGGSVLGELLRAVPVPGNRA